MTTQSTCRSTVRRFDGDAVTSLHTAIVPPSATGLRLIALAVLSKASGRYVAPTRAPRLTIAWVPQEKVRDETSSATEIDAALASPDQIPLIVVPARRLAHAYVTDEGHAFPVVNIKGTPMVLAIRVERIVRGTHGQLTFGWETAPCR